MSNADELAAFATQLADQSGAERTPPASWGDAFRRLSREIRDDGRTVVLLDEISWLAHFDDSFADDLKIAWDTNLKRHDRLILILCGSVSSWIRDNIVENGAYLGRRSLDIVVRELPLADCARFWEGASARLAPGEFFDVLSVTGGVPRYLEEIDPGASAAENIRRLAFLRNSVLRVDFDEMFSDVITRRPAFSGRVLRALSDGARGADSIASALKLEKGGGITDAIGQLQEAGLVALDAGRNPETGAAIRDRRYRLRDNYARFYLKFIEPVKDIIDDGTFRFSTLDQFEGWDTVMGLQFENLIVNNYRELLDPLHLGDALVTSATPFLRQPSRRSQKKGVQIDLLIQTRLSICLVEIKRRREIGREVIAEMQEKCRRIARPDGVSLRTALVYEGKLAPSVEADGYFDAIVPARNLLGL